MLSLILGQQAAGGSGWSSMLMIVAIVVIFYFMMIRPQNKKQKELKRMRDAMTKGDKVVTAGGIHGRVREVKNNSVMIEVAPGVTLKVDKTSVFIDENSAKGKDDKVEKGGKEVKTEKEEVEDKK